MSSRVPRTPELEAIWADQVKQRAGNPAQRRFWLPSEVSTYVPTPPDQVPAKYRKKKKPAEERDSEASEEPPKKKRKTGRKGGQGGRKRKA
jgi:hypothetical protein